MRKFQGRVVAPGKAKAIALVSKQGFNTLASYQKSVLRHDKKAKCSDQNNTDVYNKAMAGSALCLPKTIGSTTGGMILYTVAELGMQPACLLFSEEIDSLAAAGVLLVDIWQDVNMPTIDKLGKEFLDYVQTGMQITIEDNGVVIVE